MRLIARLPQASGLAGDAAQRLYEVEAMLEASPVGVVLADNQGRIVHGNSAVERLVGHTVIHSDNYDDYGTWISFHADGRQVESHEYPLAIILREGVAEACLDVHYQRGDDQRRFWMRIVGRELLDATGKRIGATVALLDIDAERRALNLQQLLIRELNHRVKNAFAVVQSIVAQSLRHSGLPIDERHSVNERIAAYARAHAQTIGRESDSIALDLLIRSSVSEAHWSRLDLDGPAIEVGSKLAATLALVFYELGTNALKYGAWSNDLGRVAVCWHEEGERLSLCWVERGGPLVVPSDAKGFGSFILERAIVAETGGTVEQNRAPEGLSWKLDMPAARLR